MSKPKPVKDIYESVNKLITAYRYEKPGKEWLSTEDLCRILDTNEKNARYFRNKLVKAKLATKKNFMGASGNGVVRHTYILLSKEAKKAFGLP